MGYKKHHIECRNKILLCGFYLCRYLSKRE
nr:MAG TPA: hypothetical protein [Caudoviricetes sp.]